MRAIVTFFAFLLAAVTATAAPQPAGNIITFKLSGEDATAGKPVIRKGGGDPLEAQIYMPLFEGDLIVLEDAKSEIVIDIVNEPRKVISGPVRFEVVGKLPMTDDAWAIVSSVIGIFSGGKGSGDADTDLVSKAYGIALPSAAAGGEANFLLAEGGPVPLIWKGGKAPFALFLNVDGNQTRLGETPDQVFRFTPPKSGAFTVTIEDSEISIARLRFETQGTLPPAPEGLLAAAPSEAVAATLFSAWLARIDSGSWRLEAIRRLDALAQKDDGASRLLYVMSEGWPE